MKQQPAPSLFDWPKCTMAGHLRRIHGYLAFAAILLPTASWLSAADSSEYHDDGIVEPYVAPKEHLEYVVRSAVEDVVV